MCAYGAVPLMLLTSLAPADGVTIQKITDRVVVASSDPWSTNVIGVKTDAGLVVVDTHLSPTIGRRCREAIEQVFPDSSLAYVINTHFHLDHAGGNRAYADATIVGHTLTRPLQEPSELVGWAKSALERGRKKIQEAGSDSAEGRSAARTNARWEEVIKDYERPDISLQPSVTFTDRLTMHLGGATLRLIYYGKAHSTSDILVHIPEEKTLIVGALFSPGQLPGGYVTDDWDVSRWLKALDMVMSDGEVPEHVITGHAEATNGQELIRAREYIVRLWTAVTKAHGEGLSLEQAKARLALDRQFADYAQMRRKNWAGQEIHPKNIEAFWKCAERGRDKTDAP
jgi:cyclase